MVLETGEIPCFLAFVWVRKPAEAGSIITIEFYSELLNRVSENWEVLARRKYTDNLDFPILIIIGIFSSYQDFPIFEVILKV